MLIASGDNEGFISLDISTVCNNFHSMLLARSSFNDVQTPQTGRMWISSQPSDDYPDSTHYDSHHSHPCRTRSLRTTCGNSDTPPKRIAPSSRSTAPGASSPSTLRFSLDPNAVHIFLAPTRAIGKTRHSRRTTEREVWAGRVVAVVVLAMNCGGEGQVLRTKRVAGEDVVRIHRC